MVESGGLENRCAGNPCTVGSNPTPSAAYGANPSPNLSAEAEEDQTPGRHAGRLGERSGTWPERVAHAKPHTERPGRPRIATNAGRSASGRVRASVLACKQVPGEVLLSTARQILTSALSESHALLGDLAAEPPSGSPRA